MNQDCLFCKIITAQIPAEIIYQDEHVLAFDDLHPQAPHHKLIIPRKHIATLNDISTDDTWLMGYLLQTAQQLARQLHIADTGYRVAMNCNKAAGQMVYHIHLHLLGGRPLMWPPG